MRKRTRSIDPRAKWVALASAGLLAGEALSRTRMADLSGRVALVTGGSRGLGFLLAREFGRHGCKVALCARDAEEIARAEAELRGEGIEVLGIPCDIAHQKQVDQMVAQVWRQFGRIDILVNNAGIIEVGPIETMTTDDFAAAMDVMYWGIVYPTLKVLPEMRTRRSGRIVNVTSIGGKLSIPHLLPYSGAKFAAVGFSEGLRAELTGSGVTVTTVVPGPLRTGSFLNASFKGKQRDEFRWFALGSSLPLITMDAERAARKIVDATRRGASEVTLSLPATLGARVHGLVPGLTADLFGVAGRVLMPEADGAGSGAARGMAIAQEGMSRVMDTLTGLGRSAAERFNEYPGPVDVPPDEVHVEHAG